MTKIISQELIGRYYDDVLISYFDIQITQELIPRKYYDPTLNVDVEINVKRFDICLVLKKFGY